jgi:hypothetical protein
MYDADIATLTLDYSQLNPSYHLVSQLIVKHFHCLHCNLIKQPADLLYLPVDPLPKEIQCKHKGEALHIKPPIVTIVTI